MDVIKVNSDREHNVHAEQSANSSSGEQSEPRHEPTTVSSDGCATVMTHATSAHTASSVDVMELIQREMTMNNPEEDDDDGQQAHKVDHNEQHHAREVRSRDEDIEVLAIGQRKCRWTSRRVYMLRGDDDEDEDEDEDDITVVSPPPSGHGEDFYVIIRKYGVGDDKDRYLADRKLKVWNTDRVIGQVVSTLAPKPKLVPARRENRDTARRGIHFVDLISKVPLSSVWHRSTQILALVVFIANVVVSVFDIVRDFQYLYYKVPSLVLGLVENAVLVVVWVVMRSRKRGRKGSEEEGQRTLKHQQYIENVLHEVSVY